MNIHQIWYGPIVYPVIAVLILIALFLMIQTYKYIKKNRLFVVYLDIAFVYL